MTQLLRLSWCVSRYWSKLWKQKAAHAPAAEQLSAADVPGLLQLGMNCSRSDAALTAATMLQSHGLLAEAAADSSAAGIVRRLLVTAAVRQHQLALLYMISQPAVLRLIDAATLQKVLEQLIKSGDNTSVDMLLGKSQQPAAAQQLSSEALAQLLQTAVDKDSCHAVDRLCQLPAAQRLSAGVVAQLLKAAWLKRHDILAGHLFDALPAVQQFDAGTVAQLAELTLQQGNGTYTTCLLTLPAAKELTTDMVTHLLGAAIQQSDEVYVWRLYCTPGALQLSSDAVTQLLHAAILQGQSAIDHFANLSKLPAAAQISKEQAEQLLQAAEDCLDSSFKMRIFARLWQLPAVAEIMQIRQDSMKERRKMRGIQVTLQAPQPPCTCCSTSSDASRPMHSDATATVVADPAARLKCGVV
jgi:hypothetical protein